MKGKAVTCILSILSIFLTFACSKKTIILDSPDKRINIQLTVNKKESKQNIPTYNVYFNKIPILFDSELGIDFKDSGVFKKNIVVKEVSYKTFDKTYPIINGKTAKARNHYNEVKITLEEFEGMKQGLDPETLETVKHKTIGLYILGSESNRQRMRHLGVSTLRAGMPRSVEDVVERLEAVTNEDVMRVAEKMFDSNKIAFTALGVSESEVLGLDSLLL